MSPERFYGWGFSRFSEHLYNYWTTFGKGEQLPYKKLQFPLSQVVSLPLPLSPSENSLTLSPPKSPRCLMAPDRHLPLAFPPLHWASSDPSTSPHTSFQPPNHLPGPATLLLHGECKILHTAISVLQSNTEGINTVDSLFITPGHSCHHLLPLDDYFFFFLSSLYLLICWTDLRTPRVREQWTMFMVGRDWARYIVRKVEVVALEFCTQMLSIFLWLFQDYPFPFFQCH